MQRRDFLANITLLGVPKVKGTPINSGRSSLNLALICHLLNTTVRIEMSTCQFTEYSLMMTCAKLDPNEKVFDLLPITVNDRVPKDEIWIVAHDGTVMSKVTQLAIPFVEDCKEK